MSEHAAIVPITKRQWTLLNSTDAVKIQFQNKGVSTIQIARGGGAPPAAGPDATPSFPVPPGGGVEPRGLDDIVLAPLGGRLYAWSETDASMSVAWTDAA